MIIIHSPSSLFPKSEPADQFEHNWEKTQQKFANNKNYNKFYCSNLFAKFQLK